MRQAALPGSRHSLQVLDTCIKGKQGVREEVFPARRRPRLICMPACLSECGPSCTDADTRAEYKVGQPLKPRKVGRTEGDIGNSASH